MKKLLLFTIFFIAFFFDIVAQIRQNEFIILLNQQVNIEAFLKESQQSNYPLNLKKILAEKSGIFLIESADNTQNQAQVLSFLKGHKSIVLAQYNHELQLRNTIPNDDYYLDQWQYFNAQNPLADMDAQEAWNITTGGLTALGDTIVVAILDNGVDINHEDLQGNLWQNKNEIPNNGIDDDGNGIIDDYHGFSVWDGNGNVSGGAGHGTPIAGIIGAVGNNSKGIVGINWNVKLMIIKTNYSLVESDIIQGYNYALEQRKLYNESNGRNGAFVVATNSSWGKDYGRAIDAPIWCAFYDTLGKYGILNAVATANLNLNVEVSGDLPSTCSSDYIVAVTNINRANMLANPSAYGNISIDLGAYGDAVFSIRNNNTYGAFGGTSGATPQVAGAIALAYAAMCENDILLAKQYPEIVAQKVKNNILQGVQNNNILRDITVSGGQLNLHNTLQKTLQNCYVQNTCQAPFNIDLIARSNDSLAFTFKHYESSDSFLIKYKKDSENTYQSLVSISDTFALNQLDICSNYDFILYSICQGNLSQDSTIISFNTGGCCIAPSRIFYQTLANDNIHLKWSTVDIAMHYQLQYRKENTQSWFTVSSIVDTSYTFTNLEACSVYEYRIRILCASSNEYSNFSPIGIFRTPNCQACAAIDYCNQSANNANIFLFESINLANNTLNNFGALPYILANNNPVNLWRGEQYTLKFIQQNYQMSYVRIWIDYNQDGDFYDNGELVYSTLLRNEKNGTFSFQIPANAKYGNTRMRIAIKEGNYPNLCENYAHGQVIDLCLLIAPLTSIESLEYSEKESYFQAIISPQNIDLIYKNDEPLKSEILVCNALGQIVFRTEKVWQMNEQKNICLTPFPKNIYYLIIRIADKIFTYAF